MKNITPVHPARHVFVYIVVLWIWYAVGFNKKSMACCISLIQSMTLSCMDTDMMMSRCTTGLLHSNLRSSMNLRVPATAISTFLTVSSMLMVVPLHDRYSAVATLIRLKVLLELTRAELTSSVRYLQSRSTQPPSHAASSSLLIPWSSHEFVMARPLAASSLQGSMDCDEELPQLLQFLFDAILVVVLFYQGGDDFLENLSCNH
ncbi:hypothetical protein PVAP13_8NG247901 [Panicum virgatum]|uniref:Uncharacterized protein n=1 Tax=Panicum virgatum TaxID=38727 RepID=A0A8T0P6A5_PANVG|nr:hypothetical protein PVAP13_8NG247901 [Panicum virgatum]